MRFCECICRYYPPVLGLFPVRQDLWTEGTCQPSCSGAENPTPRRSSRCNVNLAPATLWQVMHPAKSAFQLHQVPISTQHCALSGPASRLQPVGGLCLKERFPLLLRFG